MSVTNYSNAERRALNDAVQPIFEKAGEALAIAFAHGRLSTSARRLTEDTELALLQHSLIGVGVASMSMTIAALAPPDDEPEEGEETVEYPTAQETFSHLAIAIANVIVGARRLGIDMLPLIGSAIPAVAVTVNSDHEAEAVIIEQGERVESLYALHSNLPEDVFDGPTVFEAYDTSLSGDDEDDDEDADEDDPGFQRALVRAIGAKTPSDDTDD